MELYLDPIIPMTRVINGHNSFNKGHHSPRKGKTLAELFGEEKAREILRKMSEGRKKVGSRGGRGNYHKPCVAIKDGKIGARFKDIRQASQYTGLSYSYLRKGVKRNVVSKNGWQWFYEKESWKWCDLIKKKTF